MDLDSVFATSTRADDTERRVKIEARFIADMRACCAAFLEAFPVPDPAQPSAPIDTFLGHVTVVLDCARSLARTVPLREVDR